MNAPPSPEDLDGVADRATRAAAAGRAARTAEEEMEKAAAAAAAAQSAQTAAAAAQAAASAVGVPPSPTAPAFAVPPPAQPPALPPVPPAIATSPSGKRGGKRNNTIGLIALAMVGMLTLFFAIFLHAYLTKNGSTTVSEGWQTLYASLSDRMNGQDTRIDTVVAGNAANTAANAVSAKRLDIIEPLVSKNTNDIVALGSSIPRCGTCNGNAGGSGNGTSQGGGAKGAKTPEAPPPAKVAARTVPAATRAGEVPSNECRIVAKGPGGTANLVLKNLNGRIALLSVKTFKDGAYASGDVLVGPKLTPMSAGTCDQDQEQVRRNWAEVVPRMGLPNDCTPT